ncbi:hypothetical protein [uncultured Hoeflea sp.]|uniref:hypothetical protein n=1 Tax=uncultured Hoeflea sp. TaxID=538666 RepID=UPI0030DAB484
MVELDLGKSADNAGDFLILRAKAIDEYAQLEQAMAFLFAALARTERDVASLIFFRITNASSRNRIIEDLIKRRFGDACNHFWFGIPKTHHKKGLMNLIQGLDGLRNEIVHWHIKTSINTDMGSRALSLTPPNFWSGSNAEPKSDSHLIEFIFKADFTSRAVNMFTAHHMEASATSFPIPIDDTWREIYQRPCTYPPENTHPLFRTREEP